MTPYAGVFSDKELGYIVEYIKSLSDKAPAGEIPAGQPADAEQPAD